MTPATRAILWQPIETAPRDGMMILAANNKRKQRGIVFFNSQGEWELIDMNNCPMGVGFYPTHWMHLVDLP